MSRGPVWTSPAVKDPGGPIPTHTTASRRVSVPVLRRRGRRLPGHV